VAPSRNLPRRTLAPVLNVGLTGGIGSGKSEVSRRLEAHGAVVVDADRIAREVVEPGTPGLAAVAAEFGPGVLRSDGALDRERLGAVVFADENARRRLNAIVHPLVRQRSAQIVAGLPADAVVVHDIPLLAENRLAAGFDLVVVIDAPEDAQVERLRRDRGMAEADAKARIAAQATREQRRAIADVVIDNGGDLGQLDRQVEALWDRIAALRGSPGR
jgi:dephospho-CoA kinase